MNNEYGIKSLWQLLEQCVHCFDDMNLADVCRFISFDAGEAYGPHSHVRIEINYVQRGNCRIELMQGSKQSFSEGEMMIITSEVQHRFVAGSAGCTLMQLEFRPDILFALGNASAADASPTRGFLSNANEPVIKIVENVRITRTIQHILCEIEAKAPDHRQMVMLYYAELLILIKRHIENPYREIGDNSHLRQVVQYMREHFHENISINQLAQRFDVNERFLRRAFRKTFNESPLQYLNHLRIAYAAELINNTHLSIKEVCFKSGFNSPQHFSKLYKRFTGHSPHKRS